jgi:hypothetical protein
MVPFDPYAEPTGINIQLVHGQSILGEGEARVFLSEVYSLLSELPKRIRLFIVQFKPLMGNVGGWHLAGVSGSIATPCHVVLFDINDDGRRNQLSFIVRQTVEHECRCDQVRETKFEAAELPGMLIRLLRDLVTEEASLLEGNQMYLPDVTSFLNDPMVKAAG